jgi:AcrR family transcriptional regulator
MSVRDAEATRQRLIAAGREEFARYGIAGARVDRIAATANSNKAQIYHYFGSKARLFDAVWESLVKEITDAAPLDVEDLPGFAARLAETYARHPELIRLITWQRLERNDEPPHPYAVHDIETRIAAVAAAQKTGLISSRFKASVLFALILQIAALWGTTSPDVLSVVGVQSAKLRRETVRRAVEALLG